MRTSHKALAITSLTPGEFLRCGHCKSKQVQPGRDLLYGVEIAEPDRQQIPATLHPHPSHLRCARCNQMSWVMEPIYAVSVDED